MRVVPPDTYQASGIVTLMRRFGWAYIVTLNSENVYARNGIRHVIQKATKAGICILYQLEISTSLSDNEVEGIVGQLQKNGKAKVIVSFMYSRDILRVLSAMKRRGDVSKFIFIFSDALTNIASIDTVERFAENSFVFSLFTGDTSNLKGHYGNISTYLVESNVYHKKFWEEEYGCNLTNTKLENCITKPPNEFQIDAMLPLLINSIYAFANALDSIVKSINCSNQLGNLQIRKCITGELLLKELYDIDYTMEGIRVKFDDRGDGNAKYVIRQIQSNSDGVYRMVNVGIYDTESMQLTLNSSKLDWSSQNDKSPPESVCSKPCNKGEHYVKEDINCCWRCIRCEINEITAQNGSVCTPCPIFTWPDIGSFSKCIPIEVEFVHPGDPYGFLLLVMAVFGALFCIFVIGVIFKYRKRKLIKASGKELSGLVLFGDMVAFLSVPLFVTKASTLTCYLNHFAFQMSFCLSYAPLLCKVNRVCRIFESGKRGLMRPKFITTKWQLVAVAIMYSFQVGILYVAFRHFHLIRVIS